MTRYLTLEDLLRFVSARPLLGPVRDPGLLDSAVQRPRTSLFGRDAYPAPADKAAALIHSIAQNQALVDGNKRLALLAGVVFLSLNHARLTATEDELFDLFLDMAGGLSDVAAIATRLRVAPQEGSVDVER